jgi:hypothetical protein
MPDHDVIRTPAHPDLIGDMQDNRTPANQSTPEIEALRKAAWTPDGIEGRMVPEDAAIQAVRDTEARTVREIVEALRERVLMRAAADFIESRFLSPDSPEGNA